MRAQTLDDGFEIERCLRGMKCQHAISSQMHQIGVDSFPCKQMRRSLITVECVEHQHVEILLIAARSLGFQGNSSISQDHIDLGGAIAQVGEHRMSRPATSGRLPD